MNRWTIHVKKFGKIDEARIEIAPLTLFVGDNNSGKSYMMTLIYGLLNVRFFFEGYDFDTKSPIYQECCEILDRMIGREPDREYILRDSELISFQELLNMVLADNKQKFLLTLFNRKMDAEEIRLTFPKELQLAFKIRRRMDGDVDSDRILLRQKTAIGSAISGYQINEADLQEEETGYPFLLSYIMQSMLHSEMERLKSTKRIYLPTARTGFLLTYKTLAGSAIQEKFTVEETTKNLLTKPNSDFLKELSSMNTADEYPRFQDVVDFIESHVIAGRINVSEAQTQDFSYTPVGSRKRLPLYITSGVVTEMTPLLLFLKYTDMGALMIEEPEISLHPQLQWQVARVLIRLVNKGLPVFATTHSDIIVQHMNNMIKVNESEKREMFLKESDYEKEDLLSRDDINVYQFDVEDNQKTYITKLPCGDYGFEAMTFIETLQKLNDEIDRIENED